MKSNFVWKDCIVKVILWGPNLKYQQKITIGEKILLKTA